MRDMVTCFSEHAVRVSELTCSSSNYAAKHSIVPPNLKQIPTTQNAVVCLYKIKQRLLITVTWCRNHLGQGGLIVAFGDENDPSNPSSSASFKVNTFSRLFRKKKGHKSFDVDSSKIEVLWDLSSATYNHSSPEPIDGFYVLIMVGSELGLSLGDMAHKKVKMGPPQVKPAQLVSRREHYSGPALYSTKAQFCDSGVTHDIVIRCSEDHETLKQPVLCVSIDKKTVMKIRRLQWNFRGNQTVFVDGLLVDLMWDVHDWFFASGSGNAVFMFKTRNGTESRLWLEEKSLGQKDNQETTAFSLLVYASKNP